ncbi:hypothetical protein OS493_026652 [Desmophyllum pertusum]|uniref:Uncharacterized protein n=1 Tax=Desmophyllum pertusum TaxID=174260 RepID=A0A9X0CF41_9CNID|nr:hypothetical protein OS493_026652 [Desmophyllum pertusum]
MGQMVAQVVGLSLFLLLAFCASVSAVGEGSEDIYGPSFTSSINKAIQFQSESDDTTSAEKIEEKIHVKQDRFSRFCV